MHLVCLGAVRQMMQFWKINHHVVPMFSVMVMDCDRSKDRWSALAASVHSKIDMLGLYPLQKTDVFSSENDLFCPILWCKAVTHCKANRQASFGRVTDCDCSQDRWSALAASAAAVLQSTAHNWSESTVHGEVWFWLWRRFNAAKYQGAISTTHRAFGAMCNNWDSPASTSVMLTWNATVAWP